MRATLAETDAAIVPALAIAALRVCVWPKFRDWIGARFGCPKN
jgi:hypothetical protein